MRRQVRNWAGNITYPEGRVHRPESLTELRSLVRRSQRIRAIGSGHSFSGLLHTVDDLVSLSGMPGKLEIGRRDMTVTVAAGMRYAEVASGLHRAGFALSNLASLPHITVAGACATGTHGSGDKQRSLAASVRALRLVGPDGDVVTVHRDRERETFPGWVVALGALGVVTELTIDVEPAYEVSQHVRLGVPLDQVVERFDAVFGAAYSVSLFTDWQGDDGAVWLKSRADRPQPSWLGGRTADGPVHPVLGQPPHGSTVQMGVPGPWHERLPHFRSDVPMGPGEELQSEFFLPRRSAPAAFAALRGLEALAPVLEISEVRTVRADGLWLSPAHDRDSVAFHFTWIRDEAAVLPVVAAVEKCLLPLGCRPHWAKLTTMTADVIRSRYEHAAAFQRLADDFDPAGKFRNEFVRDLFPVEWHLAVPRAYQDRSRQ
jgi:alditol oxidase